MLASAGAELTSASDRPFGINSSSPSFVSVADRTERSVAVEQTRTAIITALILKNDLTGIVSQAVLAGASLTRANFTGADLEGVNLAAADLAGADLTGVNLRAARITEANLTGADLSDTDLSGVDLQMVAHSHLTHWPTDYTPPEPFDQGSTGFSGSVLGVSTRWLTPLLQAGVPTTKTLRRDSDAG